MENTQRNALPSRESAWGLLCEYTRSENLRKHMLAVEYKNHAALDGLTAKTEAVRDKVMGGKQQAQQLGEKRQEMREIVGSELMQEINLR